jgi:hypothetical protein
MNLHDVLVEALHLGSLVVVAVVVFALFAEALVLNPQSANFLGFTLLRRLG